MRRNLIFASAIFVFVAGTGLTLLGIFHVGQAANPGTPPLVPFDVRTPVPTEQATGTPTGTPVATETARPAPPAAPDASNPGPVARMLIPAIGVDYPIEQIGLLPGNVLDTPHDALGKIGWYYIYPKPGAGGNAVFSGHVNYNFKEGPFANLAKVQAGDQIIIQMTDGSRYTYRIFKKTRYDVSDIPMAQIIWPSDRPDGQDWITLITCGGNFVPTQANGLGEYTQRDVVVAERVS